MMREILSGWDFDQAIVKQVRRKVGFCEERIDELHKKASARSNFYTDLLLLFLSIATSVTILLQPIEFGRNMAHDADLAVYERNTTNIVEWIAERPTDTLLLFSAFVLLLFCSGYAWFRRIQVMD